MYLVADVKPPTKILLRYFPSHLNHLPLRSDSSARYKRSPILSQIAGNFGHLTDESDNGLHAPTGASASRSRRKPQLKANLVKTRDQKMWTIAYENEQKCPKSRVLMMPLESCTVGNRASKSSRDRKIVDRKSVV